MEIPVVESKEFKPTVIPNNFYKAVVKNVKSAEGQFGTFLVLEMEVIEGDHKGAKLDAMCNFLLNAKTKLYKWLKELGAPVPEVGKAFNTDALIGKVGKVLTKTKDKVDRDNKPFKQSYIDDIEAA
jgi:hypothetical protein